MTVQQAISKAISLRRANAPERALETLQAIAGSAASDPDWNYQVAWTYDMMGQESAAVPFYEAALANGLKEDRAGAYLGLGSTYRCLGQYEKSLETFDRGLQEFPQARQLAVFRALTLYNLGRNAVAVEQLLLQLLDTTTSDDICKYEKALRFYADKLDQTWP